MTSPTTCTTPRSWSTSACTPSTLTCSDTSASGPACAAWRSAPTSPSPASGTWSPRAMGSRSRQSLTPCWCAPGTTPTRTSRCTPSQVFLSTRRGAWILNRVGDQGYPIDVILTTRMKNILSKLLTPSMVSDWSEKRLNARFDHSHYGLKPKHRILHQHPTVNDDLPNRIISGRVRVKPNIQEFTATAAIFEDGTKEDIDAVVFATGYSFSFPFLEDCVTVVENQISLYKFMFPVHLEKPTLAFIGLIQPLGAIMPISELQCRWATRVFKGLNKLPPRRDMEADINQKKEEMAKRYVRSQRHTIQVDYIPYMDELACQLGVKPNLLMLFLTDPRLATEVLLGPCTPYQYRLQGPGRWAGARQAILTQQERIVKPLRTRQVDEGTSSFSVPLLAKLFGAVAVFAILFTYL
ncbi:dimethylaniline monooxygenase [N-oxide-forming] 5-like isoform X3 [Apteryx rowi]|uniref:dimethylaniline monooxygenase [N-oxide-forming] 5-like isoform X3 n=1 Tax=Apteryx rowi TaxID=308060 RepID=UPI000E1DBAB4|nr:dimethylaniline monooxygenase [N-oxide-forming] 5-like isoform X3 [Apteryx rowi]